VTAQPNPATGISPQLARASRGRTYLFTIARPDRLLTLSQDGGLAPRRLALPARPQSLKTPQGRAPAFGSPHPTRWEPRVASIRVPCPPNRASGEFLHRVSAGTIRSSKLDVEVTGSADHGVAALLPPPTLARRNWRMVH
jgi:hypothetical protein